MSDNLNLTISEKFEKELVTFMLWISDSDYKISKGKESEELDWTIDLLSSFEEPGRNKLECFIKELKNIQKTNKALTAVFKMLKQNLSIDNKNLNLKNSELTRKIDYNNKIFTTENSINYKSP